MRELAVQLMPCCARPQSPKCYGVKPTESLATPGPGSSVSVKFLAESLLQFAVEVITKELLISRREFGIVAAPVGDRRDHNPGVRRETYRSERSRLASPVFVPCL